MENAVFSHASGSAVSQGLPREDSLYVVLPTGEVLRLPVDASLNTWKRAIAAAFGNERPIHGATP